MSKHFCLLLLVLPSICFAQNRIGTGKVAELFNQHCASCHGEALDGGLGGPLVGQSWKVIGEDLSFIEYVQQGNLDKGMPPFKDGLTAKEIRGLEIYVSEMRQKFDREAQPVATKQAAGDFEASGVRFRLEIVADGLQQPWALSFLPDGRGLFTEKAGQLFILELDGSKTEVTDIPDDVWNFAQGGLLEVVPHPDYAENGWIYLGYASSGGERDEKAQGMTKLVRGRITNCIWTDQETLFEAPFEFHRHAAVHFGTRIVLQDGYVYFSIGDRGASAHAQDLTRPNGKIHRLHDDGRVPVDNPFVDQADAYSSVWTYGNRNPQGLALHPETEAMWASEHGPRGGDEINLIEKGNNYGWPTITYGMNYGGTPITDQTEAPGMEQPKLYWTPSIAVCGIEFYSGDLFPQWQNNLFAGGLASKELHRLVIQDGIIVEDEIVLKDEGRVRDVASGPEGALYLVLNGPDRIVRLVPLK